MKTIKLEDILVTGCRMSGTTLLASLLGGHSQINMLSESYGDDFLNLIGKRYRGCKIVIPHIRYDRRFSRIYRLFYKKTTTFRLWLRKVGIHTNPLTGSHFSIRDFENMGAKIIFIRRDPDKNIESMIRNGGITLKQAQNSIRLAKEVEGKLKFAYMVDFAKLTLRPRETLEGICGFLELPFEEQMLYSAGLNPTYRLSKIEPKT